MDKEHKKMLESILKRLEELEKHHETRKAVDKELLVMFHAVKGSLTVLGWIERFSIWLAKMAVAGGILWYLAKATIEEAIRQRGGS